MTPCRIVDTRPGQGFSGAFGPPSLSPGVVRTFQITGTTVGTPTQCGVPDNALAAQANFTVTNTQGLGDLRVWPAGSPVPLASLVNYAAGETIANAATVGLGPSGAGHNGISVRADASGTDLIIDLLGYYVPTPDQIVISDGEGTVTGTTPTTVASLFGDLRKQGHTKGILIARWQNFQETPACSGGSGTVQFVDADASVVLASLSITCGGRAWYQESAPFTLPVAGDRAYDVKVFNSVATGVTSWRVFELKLIE